MKKPVKKTKSATPKKALSDSALVQKYGDKKISLKRRLKVLIKVHK